MTGRKSKARSDDTVKKLRVRSPILFEFNPRPIDRSANNLRRALSEDASHCRIAFGTYWNICVRIYLFTQFFFFCSYIHIYIYFSIKIKYCSIEIFDVRAEFLRQYLCGIETVTRILPIKQYVVTDTM